MTAPPAAAARRASASRRASSTPTTSGPIFKGKTLLYVEQSMAWWVQSGGAVAYLVPTTRAGRHRSTSPTYVDDLDGLLLHGGADVCPRSYGEEPLKPEWEGDADPRSPTSSSSCGRSSTPASRCSASVAATRSSTWPSAARCGRTSASRARTDRVHRSQELYDHNLHAVDIEAGSCLAGLYPGTTTAVVNSIHHQAVKDVGDGLTVEATSDDGLIEALRADGVAGLRRPACSGIPSSCSSPRPTAAPDGWLDNGPILDEFLAATGPRH